MNYDDETLMAYADGELDEARSAEISAALVRDPQLARRVEQHRALRTEVAGAFAAVIDQPVPEHLVASARAGGNASGRPAPRAEVLQFPSRIAPEPAASWGGREWFAMAASLVLGALISWKLLVPAEPRLMTIKDGALVARGALAHALDKQLTSTQRPEDNVYIGLTFKSRQDLYCRSFVIRDGATAGLACRENGEWKLPVTTATEVPAGELRQAASLPPPVMSAIEASISGEPLDADGEENARLSGWDPRQN